MQITYYQGDFKAHSDTMIWTFKIQLKYHYNFKTMGNKVNYIHEINLFHAPRGQGK